MIVLDKFQCTFALCLSNEECVCSNIALLQINVCLIHIELGVSCTEIKQEYSQEINTYINNKANASKRNAESTECIINSVLVHTLAETHR